MFVLFFSWGNLGLLSWFLASWEIAACAACNQLSLDLSRAPWTCTRSLNPKLWAPGIYIVLHHTFMTKAVRFMLANRVFREFWGAYLLEKLYRSYVMPVGRCSSVPILRVMLVLEVSPTCCCHSQDCLTRCCQPGHTLDDKLQNFICFSSVAASRGSSNQVPGIQNMTIPMTLGQAIKFTPRSLIAA